jgi:hypothetical protein
VAAVLVSLMEATVGFPYAILELVARKILNDLSKKIGGLDKSAANSRLRCRVAGISDDFQF